MRGDPDLGLELKLQRVRQGLTQRAVARATGIDPARLSEVELGWRAPRPDELERLKQVLGVDEEKVEP